MATFRKRGPRQWQAQVRKKGCRLQTKTLAPHLRGTMGARRGARDGPRRISVPRRSPLHHARRIARALPLKKSRRSRNRRHLRPCVRALLRHPLAQRVVSGIRGVDIARFRDERLRRVSPGTVKWDFVIVAQLFEVARQPWGIEVHNPVRDVRPRRTSRARDRSLAAVHRCRRGPALPTRSVRGPIVAGLTIEAVKRAFAHAVRRAGIAEPVADVPSKHINNHSKRDDAGRSDLSSTRPRTEGEIGRRSCAQSTASTSRLPRSSFSVARSILLSYN
jgi:hypothetical protein